MKFAVSNDFLHMGEYVLPAGGVVTRHSEVLCQESESFLLGMEGPMTVYMTDTRETYQLKHYEGLYIPAGMKYQLINYSSGCARAIFAIAKDC